MSAKILFFDLETAPIESYTWALWKQDVIEIIQDWHLLCFSYKWADERTTHVKSLPDYKGYSKDMRSDKALCKDLYSLFSQADVVVAHNANAFDIKKANARFIYNGLPPYKPFKVIDTLKEARKHFKISSNRLDYLAKYLGCSNKIKHGGFGMWTGCLSGDKKQWKLMTKYAKQDTVVLEQVYYKLQPWMTGHNLGLYESNPLLVCPNCTGANLIKRGYSHTKTRKYRQYNCKDCGKWSRSNMCEKGSGEQLV